MNQRNKKKKCKFRLVSDYKPSGDQPDAISKIVSEIDDKKRDIVLLGVTGSGKTFTMANVIEKTQRSALIMVHNKTLAAQLYEEMCEFFPNNAVEYFVSYYDYYQPEAYIPKTDTYIEKDSAINEKIDRMRHSATRSLIEREDVIVVASVSCIYGLGDPNFYSTMIISLKTNEMISIISLQEKLIELQYSRNDIAELKRGYFKIVGDVLYVFPSHYEDSAWRISFFGDQIEFIEEFNVINNKKVAALNSITIFANSHYITPKPTLNNALEFINHDLENEIIKFKNEGKLFEAHRLEKKVKYDIEMMQETGSCSGIENYSRYFSGRNIGEAPNTLFDYLGKDSLLFVDESHVSVSQIRAMYNGDRARKNNLVNYGFRLSSAIDNRPLKFEEWDTIRPTTIYVSATPAEYEMNLVNHNYIEQIIRPTGLLDPICILRPSENQVDDLLNEIQKVVPTGGRVLVTTLTKRMAEDLSTYMQELGIKVSYLHSDINSFERIEIIHSLRKGDIEVLVGVNLLREGLDIPECRLVAILDADKEGFLRSRMSLIQTIGRASRNIDGFVLLYANKMTKSLAEAIGETERRRKKQEKHNQENGITPYTIKKNISKAFDGYLVSSTASVDMKLSDKEIIDEAALYAEMLKAAEDLNFEKALKIREKIKRMRA